MKLYLAHPFDSRRYIRKWELGFEKRTCIDLINPFYDITRKDVDLIDAGIVERYEKLKPIELVNRDLEQIKGSKGIITIVDGNLSYGTIQEMVYANIYEKLVYSIISNGHENHPWLKYHSYKIFTKLNDFEKWIKRNIDNGDLLVSNPKKT